MFSESQKLIPWQQNNHVFCYERDAGSKCPAEISNGECIAQSLH